MMKIREILASLEHLAPLSLQEEYDNAGLVVGCEDNDIEACLVCIDVTEDVIDEAVANNCKLIISHHPVIFRGLKRLAGLTMTERIVEKAIREDIALCSMHTNLDNVYEGVNRKICEMIGMEGLSILRKSKGNLRKLVTFCPAGHAEKVREAIFSAGAGKIGNYDQCSFNADGSGTFRAGDGANPFVGNIGEQHMEKEVRIETVFPSYLQNNILKALFSSHPYEEVAYDIYTLDNEFDKTGAGMKGKLKKPMSEQEFLTRLKNVLNVACIRHSPLRGKQVETIAVCGGSGSFLIQDAIRSGADFFVTADIKYHQFFDAEAKIVIADVGHFESEQFTCLIITDYLKKNFPNFAVRISETSVNPVNYF
jgi:dinuclear metal center YbgI/SA1388 family protein